jgi:hypothetical protein
VGINKNFVVRHGFEASTDLILADADTRKVGIGTTRPVYDFTVAGGIGATDFYLTGIGTFVNELNVGLGGTVLTVLGIGNSIGIGTALPQYLLDIRSPVSTGQTALYVGGDIEVTGDIRADDVVFDDAIIDDLKINNTFYNIGVSTFLSYVYIDDTLEVTGITTLGSYVDINDNVDISGAINVGGATTLGGYVDINNSVDISNDLNVVGVSTIATVNINSGQIDVTRIGTSNLSATGIGTINTLLIGTQSNKATISYATNTARTLTIPSLGGNRTFAFINQDQTFTGTQAFSNINATGVSTLGNARISSGIITATSGIITYFGDGSNLLNLPPGSPSGSNSEVQYNNNGSFAGSPNFTFDGNNVNVVGIVTALEFYGDGSNLTGIATGGGNVILGITTVTELNVTGITTLTSLEVTGSSTFGNILLNPVGIITAVSGIVTYYGDGSNLIGVGIGSTGSVNTVGIITASAFFGDGSGLIGAGSTVFNDITTDKEFFPLFTDITTGTITASGISTSKLTFNPSTGTLTVIDINSTSDIRLKENIQTVDNALEILNTLRGVSFDWKETGKSSYGVIAQELEEVLPELVKNGEVKSVNYNGLIGVLIEAIKELSEQVKELKNTK